MRRRRKDCLEGHSDCKFTWYAQDLTSAMSQESPRSAQEGPRRAPGEPQESTRELQESTFRPRRRISFTVFLRGLSTAADISDVARICRGPNDM